MADIKLSAIPTATSMAIGDKIPFTSDPGGTPVSKNITRENLFSGYPASAVVSGCVELATNAETAAGTDAARATTPDDIKFRHDSETENYNETIMYPALSTDGTLAGNSDLVQVSEKAIKTYADTKVQKTLFDANSIIAADADDTPTVRAIAEAQVVGRLPSGTIKGLAQYELASLIAATENTFEIIAYA